MTTSIASPGARGAVRARGLAALALAGALACGGGPGAEPVPVRSTADEAEIAPAVLAAASYVGAASCSECHRSEAAAWKGSHHDLAMQEASDATVLGDFDGASFEAGGVTTTFSRRGDAFVVRTEGADGELHDYEVAYTFGVEPLQQYLIPFPGGRYQALGIAWDTRPRAEGGQRWFHLYPDRPPRPGNPLHWTGLDQTWNHMCAECHSTDLEKGYVAGEGRYQTTWKELDVACEACHGPGSAHVAWARAAGPGPAERSVAARSAAAIGLQVDLRDRDLDAWKMDPETGIARRTSPLPSRLELETCARCHSRRGVVAPDYHHGRPLLDTHRPALLDAGLYFADGQILDEVYEYGSFLQSKMYAAGVTCSDCHDPHSLRLLAGGDAVCARCHAPERFAAESHHHHPPGSEGARCVACHMPERTYMVVDRRRDHGLRLPRPDLDATTGAPDACTGCHRDRDPQWAASAIDGWLGGRKLPRHWGETLAAARREDADAQALLLELLGDDTAPAIARGTALTLLDLTVPASRSALEGALGDADGLVRFGALRALEGQGADLRLTLAPPLLRDPLLTVRVEAARLLAAEPAHGLGPELTAERSAPLEELRASLAFDADRPEARLNSGNIALGSGDVATAEREYRAAIALDPTFAPAQVNLADVLRATERDQDAVVVLEEAIRHLPGEAALHHALGLALVRVRRQADALVELQRAAELAPDQPRFAYVYAVGLHSLRRSDEAVAVLERELRRRPDDGDVLFALASIERQRGRLDAALSYARRVTAVRPADAGARSFVADLERAIAAAKP